MHFSAQELRDMGVTIGRDVSVHRTAILINPRGIIFGDHVRIDCFSLLSAGAEGMHVGRNVHLGAGVYLFGGGGRVMIEDFAGLSARVAVYTASDDYTEGYLTNPTVPTQYRKLSSGAVLIRRHAIVGSGAVIMPAVTVGQGAAVGALTYVRKDVGDFQIVSGNPQRVIGTRDSRILERERQYLDDEAGGAHAG